MGQDAGLTAKCFFAIGYAPAGKIAVGSRLKPIRGRAEPCASDTHTARLTMIVLDGSVVVELLTNGALADSIRSELSRRDESLIVPHLIDVEVVSAIRRLAAAQRIGAIAAINSSWGSRRCRQSITRTRH